MASEKPAPRQGNRPSRSTTNSFQGTASCAAGDILNESPDRRHSTPTAAERREAELRAELESLGYSVSVRCKVCHHPLTTARSVDLHIGPKCAKAVTE